VIGPVGLDERLDALHGEPGFSAASLDVELLREGTFTVAGFEIRAARVTDFRRPLHDDATREYAYGPAKGMRDTKVGAFSQKLYDEAGKKGWTVISMKDDWRKIFAFE